LSELVGERISQQLMLWALICLMGAVVALWRSNHSFWRPFWFMTAVWALVNAAIAYGGWLGADPDLVQLRKILWINAALDLLYIALGLGLCMRPAPMLKGFGFAIAIQGLFLLTFDLYHALQI